MDELEKSGIRIAHWIHHNADHKQSYLDTAEKLASLGQAASADAIKRAVELLDQANKLFEDVLAGLPTAEHSHDHGHDHGHSHCCGKHNHSH